MDDNGGQQVEPGHGVELALATVRERDTLVAPKLDWLARFVPDARAKEKLHDNQPKLSDGQQPELCRMRATGEYSNSDLAELFPVSRPTVYRTLNGHIPLSVRSCPLPESTRLGVTLYGYARVSVREPEDKDLDLQVERLVRAGCAMGNIRADEASGAKDDRGGLLELLDLVVEGDTLVVTRIDRISRGLTFGLQVIEGLHHAGVEFRSLAEDFDTATANGKLQLQMVLAFSE